MYNEKLSVAFIGCGNFAKRFVPLMQAHPYVEKVYVCDLIREKAEAYAKRFGAEIVDTFEEVLARGDINCIANFTQRHLHGDIVIRALKAGKHVYSAVPMAPTVEECQEIVRLVKETGLTYLMGETCYYYPCAMYCREAYREGKFGNFTYGASQYYHHIDTISYGKRPGEGGMPPLLYPTHSTGMILSAVNSYATKVVCFGYEDKTNDGRFGVGCNYWDNTYSNQYVLMKLANGGTARVTEARTFGISKPSSYISALYGTKAGYEFSNAQHILIEKDPAEPNKERAFVTDVSDYVNPTAMADHKHEPDFMTRVANGEWQVHDFAKVQAEETKRLPASFEGLPNAHMASHQFLIDDFCKAAYTGEIPALNAWTSARYTIPGLVAIESCKLGGVPLDVPDCGDAPKDQ